MWSFVLLASLTFVSAVQSMELIAVQSIFRHGDRAPSNPLPKGQIGIENWPNGWSQLTELGAMQCKELGSYYQRRYAKKLKLFNIDKEVIVRSTSKTRAIESAQNMLSGLFDRKLLKPNSFECNKYDAMLSADNERLFSRYNKLYRGFFARLSDLTGYNVTMQNIDNVFDATYREVVHGFSKDEWLWEQVLNKETGQLVTAFELIVELKRIQRLAEFNSAEKSKLRTGYLLGQIFDRFERISNGENLEKLTLLSSHDATLTSLLYSLNASNEMLVPYAAAISFELYVDGLHMPTYYVKTLYRNETGNDQAHVFQLHGCERPACELNEFKKAYENAIFITQEEQRQECKNN
ncbi:hypothetical protein M3Y97_00860200 [Aphelenchoides bicaudatus]|nr:hypothetical protein M3Y97_00860200 [Aphelenchoides bicaudatus]